MSMQAAIEAFRQYLVSEKRASAHTVRAYLHDVEELAAFARGARGVGPTTSPPLDELDVVMCRSYLASLHGRNDAVTIGRKLSSLRAFFRLAVRRRLVAASPVAALRGPKRAKRLPSFLGKEDVGRLLDGAVRRRDGRRPTRALERALFEVIYGAGLRVSEACNLDLDDVEADGQRRARSRVRQGKGRKDRIVPLGSQGARRRCATTCPCGAAPARAGAAKPARGASRRTAGDALFVTRARPAPGPARRAPAARAPRGATGDAARSRRTRSATASRPTCSARAPTCAAIQEMLGHASLRTTQRYAHVDIDHLMAVYDKAHPRARSSREAERPMKTTRASDRRRFWRCAATARSSSAATGRSRSATPS